MCKNLTALVFIFLFVVHVSSAARLKDITVIEGNRDNQLVGYGLVVGLAGKGDSKLGYTIQSLSNTLKRFGLNIPLPDIKTENVAAVMITADLGPFSKEGARLDVTVSSLGDADTLQGGVLLQTPLLGADNTVYAVAQGPVVVGGFFSGSGGEGGATVQKNHPTVGMIAGGAIVERRINTSIVDNNAINLLLLNPDFTSAVRLSDAVNRLYPGSSMAKDLGTVNVQIPESFIGQEVNFIAAISDIDVVPDMTAKVIINERTGTIVATHNVRISTVAVSYGSLTISIASNQNVSQPLPFSETGDTEVTSSTETSVDEQIGGFKIVQDFPTIERLTAALNTLGVSTREMISIFQSIKSAGSLQAELVIN
tara:strand:- start:2896 stop:3996 length:1101 start_codon:yes stop_codon:yes gene_type:complete